MWDVLFPFSFYVTVEQKYLRRDMRKSPKYPEQEGELNSKRVPLRFYYLCVNTLQTVTAEIESAGDRSTNTSLLRVKVALSTLQSTSQSTGQGLSEPGSPSG